MAIDYSSFRSIPIGAYHETHPRTNPNTIANRAIGLVEACGLPLPGYGIPKTVLLASAVASGVFGYYVTEIYASYILSSDDFWRSIDLHSGLGELSYGQLWGLGGIWLAATLTAYRVLASFRRMGRRRSTVHYHMC